MVIPPRGFGRREFYHICRPTVKSGTRAPEHLVGDALVVGVVPTEVLSPDDIPQGASVLEPANGTAVAVCHRLRRPEAVLRTEVPLLVAARKVVSLLPSVCMPP